MRPAKGSSLSPGLSSSPPENRPDSLAETVRALVVAVQALTALTAKQSQPAQNSQSQTVADDIPSLPTAVRSFLSSKARSGRSPRYVRQLRTVLSHLPKKGIGAVRVDQVTPSQVETAFAGQEWSARTLYGALKDARTFFDWCSRRGWLTSNPAKALDLPRADVVRVPVVISPNDASQLLDQAFRRCPDAGRWLAIALFAGIRSAELHRLRETDIKDGWIEVPASKSKTRSRRLVDIQPALAAWLAQGGTLRAMSPNLIRSTIRATGVKIGPNALRQSFVSYHLAAFESPGKTALQSGHSEGVLFRHYRAVVPRGDALRFWGIRPRTDFSPPPGSRGCPGVSDRGSNHSDA